MLVKPQPNIQKICWFKVDSVISITGHYCTCLSFILLWKSLRLFLYPVLKSLRNWYTLSNNKILFFLLKVLHYLPLWMKYLLLCSIISLPWKSFFPVVEGTPNLWLWFHWADHSKCV